MFLVNYSSSSDSEDERTNNTKTSETKRNTTSESKRPLLPQAALLLGKRKINQVEDDSLDDPSKHEGRIRSFKHERGNWATYVHIPIKNNILEDIQDICLMVLEEKYNFKPSLEMHVSLSKTVVLQYHFIELFIDTLQTVLQMERSFTVSFNNLKAYTNTECTRTFLALTMDELYLKKMLIILNKVDSVMRDFKLDTFYEDPSFHISILWCIGDHVSLINNLIPLIMESLSERLPLNCTVDQIYCKSGFKEFNFKLIK
ncbi:hypothetical protein DOY81_002521 [Sarcophaga bullata]|nr:hypothetical protein DOY81_002521 [Sarcophaga bullata]